MVSLSQFGLFVLLLHIVPPYKCDDSQTFKNTNLTSDALLNIPSRLVALEQTMAIIVGELQEERSCCKEKSMPEGDIIADISQGRFAAAEEKMLKLKDAASVSDIVCKMSTNSNHDFRVLVNLVKGLKNISLKSRLLFNLNQQARESNYISTKNLIALAKCLSEEGAGDQVDEIISISSFKELLDKITENTIATFVDALKWKGDYATNSKVRAIAGDIAEWGDVSEKVMIGFVSGVFGTVDSKKILDAVSNHTDAWQALVGVDTLIGRLKDTDSFKGTIVLDIASHLNEIVARRDLHSTVQDYARRVNEKIPDCIVKLTSLTKVCVWNKHKKAFLVQSTYWYEKPYASVVIGPLMDKDNAPARATWQPQRKDGRVFFQNTKIKEHLHTSNITQAGFHRVLSSLSESALDDKYAWVVEPLGDSCFLKNCGNNEYLFASDVNFTQDERTIAGTKDKRSGSADDNPEFVWQIVSC